MKHFFLALILSFIFIPSLKSQTASDYFPSNLGYKWNYSSTPLDSLNNKIDSLKFFSTDSFAVIQNYQNKLANIVLTKSGSLDSLPLQQFEDSLFFNFDGSNAFEYTKISSIEGLLSILDSLDFDTTFSFVNFFRSLENWYSVYRFSSPVNNQYTIVSVDTTIGNDTLTLPLRFEFLGRRLNDDSLQTQIGTFNCKKFLIERGISYLIFLPPPLPPLVIPLVYIEDTVWIAPENWIVKSYIPSETVNLSVIGIPAFTIPGLETEILDLVTGLENDFAIPYNFELMQNYPNPFNPSTRIKFRILEFGLTTLKVYDMLGNEVATLINEELSPGEYEVEFNSTSDFSRSFNGGLATGVYFYSLISENFHSTKKMILIK